MTALTDEFIDEETDGDDVEDEQVEDVLTVLLQEVRPDVPFLQGPVTTALSNCLKPKALHSKTMNNNFFLIFLPNSKLY